MQILKDDFSRNLTELTPFSHGLILANDIVASDKAMRLSESVAPFVDGIKVGITSVFDSGIDSISVLKKRTGKLIIADFKVADIGFWNETSRAWEGTNARIVRKLVEAGADYVICHSIVGTSSIIESIEVAHAAGGRVLTLPYMTHKGADLFFGHPLTLTHVKKVLSNEGIAIEEEMLQKCKTISDCILVLADRIGIDGFVGPANKSDILKRYRQFTANYIFGPGIGRQAIGGIAPKEQLRTFYEVCGTRSAAIIGSAIYAATDPGEAAKQFMEWRDEIASKG